MQASPILDNVTTSSHNGMGIFTHSITEKYDIYHILVRNKYLILHNKSEPSYFTLCSVDSLLMDNIIEECPIYEGVSLEEVLPYFKAFSEVNVYLDENELDAVLVDYIEAKLSDVQ